MRLNEAQEVCEQIVAGDPNDLIALGLLGIILARLEKPEQALSVLESYVSKVPADAYAFYNMGLIYNNLGHRMDARPIAYVEDGFEAHTILADRVVRRRVMGILNQFW